MLRFQLENKLIEMMSVDEWRAYSEVDIKRQIFDGESLKENIPLPFNYLTEEQLKKYMQEYHPLYERTWLIIHAVVDYNTDCRVQITTITQSDIDKLAIEQPRRIIDAVNLWESRFL